MAKKVTIDSLPDAINDILSEYADDVYENIDKLTKQIGRLGVSAVKNSSKESFDGKKYASGWTMKAFKNRLYTEVVIYNRKQAGLAHLLENGHVKANGTGRYGFYDGKKHIAPVEQKLVEQYEREVASKL